MNTEDQQQPGLSRLFFRFLKIGAITFGGGLAMLGIMRHELIRASGWLDEEEFNDMVSLATSVPGPIAVNMGYLLGLRLAGVPGVILAVAGVLLPSIAAILMVLLLFMESIRNPALQKFFAGASAAVAAQIVYSAMRYGAGLRRDSLSIATALGAFALSLLFRIHPLILLASAFTLRMLLPQGRPQRPGRKGSGSSSGRQKPGEKNSGQPGGKAGSDDDRAYPPGQSGSDFKGEMAE